MTMPEPLPLREAVASALRMGGLEILSQPQRFTSYILDLADSSLREVRLLSRQLDTELVAPLAQATKGECTTATLLTARSRIEQILVDDRFVAEGLARSTAEGLAGGMADFMGLRLPSAVQRLSPQPVQKDEDAPIPRLEPRPMRTAPAQPVAPSSRQVTPQRTLQPQPQQTPRLQSQPQASSTSTARPTPTTTPAQPTKKNNRKGLLILLAIVFAIWSIWYNTSMPNAKNDIKSSITIEENRVRLKLYNPTDKDCVVSDAAITVFDPYDDSVVEREEFEKNQYFAANSSKEFVMYGHYSAYEAKYEFDIVPYNPLIPG